MISVSLVTMLLSGLLATSESFSTNKFARLKLSTKLHDIVPTTDQQGWKQSMRSLINVGVTSSAFLGASAALAASAKAPAVTIAPEGPPTNVTNHINIYIHRYVDIYTHIS
jgi:hypothetical protein